jgi:hypothetical protein
MSAEGHESRLIVSHFFSDCPPIINTQGIQAFGCSFKGDWSLLPYYATGFLIRFVTVCRLFAVLP